MLVDTDAELCHKHNATGPVPGFGTVEPCSAMPGISRKSSHGGPRPGAGRKPKPVAPPLSYAADKPRWYCVRTAYDAELYADMAIRKAGFATFLPLLWVAPKPARRTDIGRSVPATCERLVPLFSRYLFVQFLRSDPNWRHIATMRGVDCVFSTSPENPTAVPDRAIDAIRGQCAPNGVLYPPERAPKAAPLAVGSGVRVTEGAMTGFEGIIELSDGDRVRVLLNLFGRLTPVAMPQSGVHAL